MSKRQRVHFFGAEHVARMQAVHDRIDRGELPEYQEFVENLFKKNELEKDEFMHAAAGLAGEAGEVLDLAKKVWAYDKPHDMEKILEELGDMRFYYQALLNHFGIDDAIVKAFNMEKLSKRYASGQFSKEQANSRADKEPERRFMGPHRSA